MEEPRGGVSPTPKPQPTEPPTIVSVPLSLFPRKGVIFFRGLSRRMVDISCWTPGAQLLPALPTTAAAPECPESLQVVSERKEQVQWAILHGAGGSAADQWLRGGVLPTTWAANKHVFGEGPTYVCG